jgi:uncharacterized protein YutE (UPF0331/DUF86 family)
MDREVITEKLEALRYCISRLSGKCPDQVATLSRDPDLQDIVAMNLARSVQLCVDIAVHIVAESQLPVPNTMAEAFDDLHTLGVLTGDTSRKMRKAVGFRNIAVHAYGRIDWAVVHDICQHRLVDFERFAEEIQDAAALK